MVAHRTRRNARHLAHGKRQDHSGYGLYLPPDLWEVITILANDEGTSRLVVIENALADYFNTTIPYKAEKRREGRSRRP